MIKYSQKDTCLKRCAVFMNTLAAHVRIGDDFFLFFPVLAAWSSIE